MKTSTKILLSFNIISLVMASVLFPTLLTAVTFQPFFGIKFTAGAIVSTFFFGLWIITGLALFFKFIKRLSLSKKLFIITTSSTAVFAILSVILFTFRTSNVAPIATVSQVMQINNNMTAVFIFIGMLAILYFAFLALSFRILTKPIRKIKIAIEKINKGDYKSKIKIKGSKEYQVISDSLIDLNSNIMEKEKNIKLLTEELNNFSVINNQK